MIRIAHINSFPNGGISLNGSKSIANRALLIRALSEDDFPIEHLSTAQDTQTLIALLASDEKVLDAGPAGTTFRFLTAYLAFREGTRVLTGSARMLQRPIGVLVNALRELGADIRYLGEEGYPPLEIRSPKGSAKEEVEVAADISSQYISALLMVSPCLPHGLRIRFRGKPVSMPYIRMTLRMMERFGAKYHEEKNAVRVMSGKYQAQPFQVEADWSAASYYFAMAALAKEADLRINGLYQDSLQGDSVIAQMMESFGIRTTYHERGIHIRKETINLPQKVEWDFTECPDIAQTMAVVCAGLGVEARFSGLQTLRIKETDRIAALRIELAKVGVTISPWQTADTEGIHIQGRAKVDLPTFATYHDHRMAMAFAPLAFLGDIRIENPEVVGKSYPGFWEDFQSVVKD